MADQWGRGQHQNYLNRHLYASDDDPSFYEPPSYEQLNQSEATYSNEDYNYIQEGQQRLLPKPYISSMKKQRSPPPLPPRTEQSVPSPVGSSRRSGSSNNSNKGSSATPPSVYSASATSTTGTFMAPNLAALHNSGSLLITAESSSTTSSSADSVPLPNSGTRLGTGRLGHTHHRSGSRSPIGGDTSSAHSTSDGGGGYLMRTDSGNLFISPPHPELGGLAESPETMRTSVGGGVGNDITPLHLQHHGTSQRGGGFSTSMSHDSAVATTNTTGLGTLSSRTKQRHHRPGSTKYQEKMFENVPIRLANIQMSYDPATGTTRPLLYHTDFRSYSAMLSKVTRRLTCYSSWRCCSIFLAILLFLAVLGATFLVLHFVLPNLSQLTGLHPVGSGPCSYIAQPYFANLSSGLAASRASAPTIKVDLTATGSSGIQFYMQSPDFVAIDILKGATPYGLVGIYGRRFAAPTRFRHDFFKLIDNSVLTSAELASTVIYRLENSTVGFVEYLDEGQWFLLFSNDDTPSTVSDALLENDFKLTKVQQLTVNVFKHGPMTTGCPGDCHGHGFCNNGPDGKKSCQCKADYTGYDCSMPVCPIICSGRGRLIAGPKCFCDVGWKGSDCHIPASSCEDPNCSGRGQCKNGFCECEPGYGGPSCEKYVCQPTCISPRGVCVEGKCFCHPNFAGQDCSVQVFDNNGKQLLNGNSKADDAVIPSPTASSKVVDDVESQLCKTRCDHGRCVGERQAVCECQPGFNGRFCSIEGCPKNCSGHGKCATFSVMGAPSQYACHCDSGWKDADCSAMREKCSGGVDEDGDSLIDCADPDCCTRALCSQSPTCASVPNPILELLSLPVLPPNSPFPDRVSFLLRGVQRGLPQLPSGSDDAMAWLDQKRVSVVSGNVLLAKDNSHLVGVKVYQMAIGTSQSSIHLGYTLSREQGGAFDLLVEGGGVLWLRFEHPSRNLCPQETAIYVGWDEFKVLDAPILIEASKDGACDNAPKKAVCNDVHDHAKIYPSVFTTWQTLQVGAIGSNDLPYQSTVLPELNDLVETVPIGDTGFSLNWLGSFAKGRQANIFIRMIPDDVKLLPIELSFVKLRIAVEGVVEERLFEAEPSLSYTFSWSGKNRFNSESAGIVEAIIRIGYIYKNCSNSPIWVTRRTRLLSPVCAPVAPPFAGWFLSGQHHYDPQNAILYRSDGSIKVFSENLFLRRIYGQAGRRRAPNSCTQCGTNPECRCEGPVDAIRLTRPRDLTTDRSGNVLVLDDNAVLRFSNAESKLLHDFALERNYEGMELVAMAVHPTEESVYVADKRGRRIFKATWPSSLISSASRRNLQLVVGSATSLICSAPEQQNACGDGLASSDALLIQPKSLAFDKFGNLFVADGHVVRRISNDSKLIETYVGRLISNSDDDFEEPPSRCWQSSVHRLKAGQLIDWPIAVVVNPLDDTLYVADSNNVIYQVTTDDQLVLVAGRAPSCASNPRKPDLAPENFRFRSIRDMHFALNGDLYIVQSKPAEVLVLTADRLQLKSVTGQRCAQANTCIPAFNRTSQAVTQSSPAAAADLTFADPSSIVALPNGAVFVADASENAVYVLEQVVPTPTPGENLYDVYDVDLDQIHRFDMVGNHKMTLSASTGVALVTFTYHTEGTLQAPLSKVTNPATGYELTFNRNFVENSFVSVITSNIGGQMFSARVQDASTPMDVFIDANNRTTVFSYTPESQLLRSVLRPDGQKIVYDYDANTRLIRASSSGAVNLLKLESKSNEKKGMVTRTETPFNGLNDEGLTYEALGDQLSIIDGAESEKISRLASSVWLVTSRDSSGGLRQLSLVDSRTSGTAGLDGRNWVSVNGNMSAEWRRTSPPSSTNFGTLANIGQLLRQLRVTDSRSLMSVSTSMMSSSGSMMMMKRGFYDDHGRMQPSDQPLVSSVAQNIILIAHLNRTSQPQRETFFNLQTPASNSSLQQQSAVQLLFVTYDDADRPMQIKPAHHKFPTVRLSYVANCRRGRITTAKFGDVESSWQPDQRGLLKLRNFADGRSIQFMYGSNSTLLQSATLVGGQEVVSMRYTEGGLQSISQNNKSKFTFRAIEGLEFSRRILTLPSFFADSGDLKVVLDKGFTFTRQFVASFGGSSATASFSLGSGAVSNVQFSGGQLSFKQSTLNGTKASSTVLSPQRQIELTSSSISGLLHAATFEVDSSNALRFSRNVTHMELTLPKTNKKLVTSLTASPNNYVKVVEFGKVEKVHVGNATVLYELDNLGRLVHSTLYEPNSRKPLVQSTAFYEIVHQEDLETAIRSPWRIARTLWHVLSSNELYAHIYEWASPTEGSQLKSVKIERSLQNGKSKSFGTSMGFTWSLPAGNLAELTTASASVSASEASESDTLATQSFVFKTGLQDQLLSISGFGDVSYDKLGCIAQIGQRKFAYNSMRQLVGLNAAKFTYDPFGRISHVSDGDFNLAILYDSSSSSKILLSTDIKTGKVLRYHYSPVTGCIDGYQEDLEGPVVVVLSDPWCSPVLGIANDGTRLIFPSLTGASSFAGQQPATNQDVLVAGYHGFVQLRQYGILFVDQVRAVDTLTGRALCPDFSQLLADDPQQQSTSLAFGRNLASGQGSVNLFQFSGPEASSTNFHLLSADQLLADNFVGSPKAWLAKVLAPNSLSLMSDENLMLEREAVFSSGQTLSTLIKHHKKTFGISTRAEMSVGSRLNSLSSLSASSSASQHDHDWPVFVPPPLASPILAHAALTRLSLSSNAANIGDSHRRVFELLIAGKAPSTAVGSQYQSLIKLLNVVLNGTLYIAQTDQYRFPLSSDSESLKYDVFKANESLSLQSDLALLALSCTDRVNFGGSVDFAADCSRNIVKLQTSPNHLFVVHYGVNVKERYFN